LRLFEEHQKKSEPFSVVLMDKNMPGFSGYQTIEKLRGLPAGANIPILILTSSPVPGDREYHTDLRILKRISKPIMREELREALQQALHGATSSQAEAGESEDGQSERPLHILLTEDNAVNQKLAMRLLEKMGHRVMLAVNGEEALQRLRRRGFDLILMDIQMPIMGGVQATQAIREAELESGHRTPIIATTAHALKGDREKYLASGMDGYVSKPIDRDRLIEEIRRVVRG
jgi:CheY-like chemotaxis protein